MVLLRHRAFHGDEGRDDVPVLGQAGNLQLHPPPSHFAAAEGFAQHDRKLLRGRERRSDDEKASTGGKRFEGSPPVQD